MTSTPLLDARALRVQHGGRTILHGVDFQAHAGEVVGILGPSGAGKTTLFRSLVGDLAANSGVVRLADREVTTWPLWKRARAGIAYMPQTPSVLWDLSVRDNLAVFHDVAGAPATSALLEEAAERVGLSERLRTRAGDLSSGERRRLEFARAITRPPRVLVCDEPFAGVDPAAASRLGDLLVRLAASGVAVLFADHHVEESLRICTRAVLLLDGAIAAEDSPGMFRSHPLVEGRYLGSWSRTIPPPPP